MVTRNARVDGRVYAKDLLDFLNGNIFRLEGDLRRQLDFFLEGHHEKRTNLEPTFRGMVDNPPAVLITEGKSWYNVIYVPRQHKLTRLGPLSFRVSQDGDDLQSLFKVVSSSPIEGYELGGTGSHGAVYRKNIKPANADSLRKELTNLYRSRLSFVAL